MDMAKLYTLLTGTLSGKILPSNIPSPTVFGEFFYLWYYDRSRTLVPVKLFSKQCKGWFFFLSLVTVWNLRKSHNQVPTVLSPLSPCPR